MPAVLQYLNMVEPIRHIAVLLRGIVLKEVGLDVLWPQLLALFVFS